MESRSVFLADAAATQALGRELALQWLRESRLDTELPIVLLRGDLGAGKTCLVQGIASALGIDEAITSPTFALAQHYQGRRDDCDTALVHLDLYRLDQPGAADEVFAQEEEEASQMRAMMAVEWSERLSFEPAKTWTIELKSPDIYKPENGRIAHIRTTSKRPI